MDYQRVAEYLAIHFDPVDLARAAIDAVGGRAIGGRACDKLAGLIAGARTSRALALDYLELALTYGTLFDQFPELAANTSCEEDHP